MVEVYVLRRGEKDWNIVDDSYIDKWVRNGNIEDGDLIVYPLKVMEAKLSVKLESKKLIQEEERIV